MKNTRGRTKSSPSTSSKRVVSRSKVPQITSSHLQSSHNLIHRRHVSSKSSFNTMIHRSAPATPSFDRNYHGITQKSSIFSSFTQLLPSVDSITSRIRSPYTSRYRSFSQTTTDSTETKPSKPRLQTTSIPSGSASRITPIPKESSNSDNASSSTASASTTASAAAATPTPRTRRPLRSAVTVTPSASDRIKFLCEQQETPAKGIRLGVRTRGCNGMSYTMNFADAPQNKFDEVVPIPQSDINLFVDNKALLHVIGTTMDYVETDVSAEFVFNNPNSKGSCGCGESFTT